ncbi:hypothetical protein LINPERPRIM_LOCUS20414 [Linum perenne]
MAETTEVVPRTLEAASDGGSGWIVFRPSQAHRRRRGTISPFSESFGHNSFVKAPFDEPSGPVESG